MMSKQQNEHGIFVFLLSFLLFFSAFEGHERNRQTDELGRLLVWRPHIGVFVGKRKLLFRCEMMR